ncbi:MAG: hypothetical protein R6W95_07080 [Desulfosarcina sp.]
MDDDAVLDIHLWLDEDGLNLSCRAWFVGPDDCIGPDKNFFADVYVTDNNGGWMNVRAHVYFGLVASMIPIEHFPLLILDCFQFVVVRIPVWKKKGRYSFVYKRVTALYLSRTLQQFRRGRSNSKVLLGYQPHPPKQLLSSAFFALADWRISKHILWGLSRKNTFMEYCFISCGYGL